MTRINVGIEPHELCDQMLIAEIHELPRVFKFRDNAGPKQFTLGKGHVLWCARYHESLIHRYHLLTVEAAQRKFATITYDIAYLRTKFAKNANVWATHDELVARPLLQERINLRLSQMKRIPSWRNCTTQPAWVTPHWIGV